MLRRVISSVDNLNAVMGDINTSLSGLEQHRDDLTFVDQVWSRYYRNVGLATSTTSATSGPDSRK